MRDPNATGRSDSTSMSPVNKGRCQPSDSKSGEIPEPESEGNNDQAGNSRDATTMATAIKPLNRSLETFLTRVSRTSERSKKSGKVFKKPRNYNDESDLCIVTWIKIMELYFEEEDLTGKTRKQ